MSKIQYLIEVIVMNLNLLSVLFVNRNSGHAPSLLLFFIWVM